MNEQGASESSLWLDFPHCVYVLFQIPPDYPALNLRGSQGRGRSDIQPPGTFLSAPEAEGSCFIKDCIYFNICDIKEAEVTS